jgi:glycosyltransferase involved in cell wall biosynthesis
MDRSSVTSISFVVPIRNRSEEAIDFLSTPLLCPRWNIEIIVRDNNSIDDTVFALKQIADPRDLYERLPFAKLFVSVLGQIGCSLYPACCAGWHLPAGPDGFR